MKLFTNFLPARTQSPTQTCSTQPQVKPPSGASRRPSPNRVEARSDRRWLQTLLSALSCWPV
jgi:hypothetical protein